MDFLTNPTFLKNVTVWFGAICTLGIYSILYKENKVFRFFEHLFIGLATGYTIYTTWNDVLKPRWWEPMTDKGLWWWAFALPAGLLFYMVYSKKNVWMSRLIFGVFFGAAAGREFQRFSAQFFPQIRSAIAIPLVNPPETQAPGAYWLTPISAVLNNLLFLLILASVMTYFFFTFSFTPRTEKKVWFHSVQDRVAKGLSQFGRYVLMFAFGAIFGSTIMARMSLVIGRLYFLIHDWIQVTILGHSS